MKFLRPFERAGWDAGLNRDVAIKVSGEQFSERFESAAKAIAALNHPDNPEAYRLYLKGKYYTNKLTKEGFDTGIDYFNQAVDPNYGLAYSGLAFNYVNRDDWFMPPTEAGPKTCRSIAIIATTVGSLLGGAGELENLETS
jgi:hypothetical protein